MTNQTTATRKADTDTARSIAIISASVLSMMASGIHKAAHSPEER